MTAENNKVIVCLFMEQAFNQGNLAAVDEHLAATGIDHQEPSGTDFRAHLKQVITGLRTAFPDLHFELHEVLAEGEIVAFRSTMTGTHLGSLQLGPGLQVLPTGRPVSVPHMHFVRMVDGKGADLWHQMDTKSMMCQLGLVPEPQRTAV